MRLHAEFAGWATFRDVLMVIEQCCSARDTPAFAAMSEPVGKTRPATAQHRHRRSASAP